jgi:two-component system sensor histidine kinase VicK
LERSASSAFVDATNVVPEGVMYIARGERLCYANKMACRLLGIEFEADSARSGGGHKLLGDLPVSDLGQKIVAAVQSAKASQQFESKSVNVEGESESAFRVRVMPVLQKDPGAIVLITDVSQQAKADAAREAFLAQVTHELRTPLTNIRAYTETYAEFDDPKVQAECFNVINKETRRLARLVEEMLSRSQLDVGSMTVRRDDVDLLSLVGESVRDLNATAKSKGIDLQAKLPSKLPALRADRDKLSVVVNNLLGNALKYTESGGSVSIACQADDEQVRILVSDTGIGIGADDQLRIFEHLYRVDSQEVRTQLGSGIGLTTALEIIKAHGGDITVKSEAGKGSTFTIELPLAAAAAGREA